MGVGQKRWGITERISGVPGHRVVGGVAVGFGVIKGVLGGLEQREQRVGGWERKGKD